MRHALAALASLLAVAACSSGGDLPCALLAVGAQCSADTDCCTGYCDLEGDVAACQKKPANLPACVGVNAFCTQDRNCCSGFCTNNACTATIASCLSLGSGCVQNDSCCSNYCRDDGEGHTACTPQPGLDGGTCGMPGAPCSTPGPDPDECCFVVCGADGTCSGGNASDGGGPTCGAAGAFCRYGSDCCSGECEQLTSTSACQ